MRPMFLIATGFALVAMPAMLGAQDPAAPAAPVAEAAAAAAQSRAPDPSWSPTQQAYYRTLPVDQQAAYWLLGADQRAELDAMAPDQRAATWGLIVAQVQAQAVPAASPEPAVTAVTIPGTATTAQTTTITTTMSNMAPPPADAMNKDYPVCTKQVQDSCRNPGAR